jgi:hypothetical protein
VPFNLEGYNGFLPHLEKRIVNRHHAVIVVAEGAMQDQILMEKKAGRQRESQNGRCGHLPPGQDHQVF